MTLSSVNPFQYQLVATQAVPNATAFVGVSTNIIPIATSGGEGPKTFTIDSPLSNGLSYNSATGQITGTATATQSSTAYTITSITDSAGNSAVFNGSNTFNLTINPGISSNLLISSQTLTHNSAINSFIPVTGSGGSGSYTYSATLPAGLSINPSTGAVTGTPTTNNVSADYPITVTDNASPNPYSIQNVTMSVTFFGGAAQQNTRTGYGTLTTGNLGYFRGWGSGINGTDSYGYLYTSVGNITFTAGFTCEFFVFFNQMPTGGINLFGHGGGNNQLTINISSTGISMANSGYFVLASVSRLFQAGVWYHIVIQGNSTTTYIGVNGTLTSFAGARGAGNLYSYSNTFGSTFYLGCVQPSDYFYGNPATGWIDFYIMGFRIVSGTLVYGTGATYTQPTTNLTAVAGTTLLLFTSTATSITDTSGLGRTVVLGSVNNDSSWYPVMNPMAVNSVGFFSHGTIQSFVPIRPNVLPGINAAAGPILFYSISPSLPTGLTFNNGLVSGFPTVASSSTTYTVTLRDSTQNPSFQSSTNTFVLNITGLSLNTAISAVGGGAAGGGGPGVGIGGGGGAGGATTVPARSLTVGQTYTVTVGGGGTSSTVTGIAPFAAITAVAGSVGNSNPLGGASGGAAGGGTPAGGGGYTAPAPAGATSSTGGGGGGRGTAGFAGSAGGGGRGGTGGVVPPTGSVTVPAPLAGAGTYGGTIGGGGGGGGWNNPAPASPGGGGSGSGFINPAFFVPLPGTANTGGGGGGSVPNINMGSGVAGGSGFVIVSYTTPTAGTAVFTANPASNITYVNGTTVNLIFTTSGTIT